MIQAAISAPLPGEAIHLAAGRYSETLSINESLTLAGSGTNKCVLYCLTNIPIVTINGPGTVTSSHLEINGGQYFSGDYNGTSPLGITPTKVNPVMNTVVMEQICNYLVTLLDGSIAATNVSRWTRGRDDGLRHRLSTLRLHRHGPPAHAVGWPRGSHHQHQRHLEPPLRHHYRKFPHPHLQGFVGQLHPHLREFKCPNQQLLSVSRRR